MHHVIFASRALAIAVAHTLARQLFINPIEKRRFSWARRAVRKALGKNESSAQPELDGACLPAFERVKSGKVRAVVYQLCSDASDDLLLIGVGKEIDASAPWDDFMGCFAEDAAWSAVHIPSPPSASGEKRSKVVFLTWRPPSLRRSRRKRKAARKLDRALRTALKFEVDCFYKAEDARGLEYPALLDRASHSEREGTVQGGDVMKPLAPPPNTNVPASPGSSSAT